MVLVARSAADAESADDFAVFDYGDASADYHVSVLLSVLLHIIVYKKSLNAQKSTIDTGQSLCYNLLNQRRLPDIAVRLPDIAILSAPNKQNQKKGEQV